MVSQAPQSDHTIRPLDEGAALQHGVWRSLGHLSRVLGSFERFLENSGFDRAPWLTVAFATGIGAWFGLSGPWQWLSVLALCLAIPIFGAATFHKDGKFLYVRQSLIVIPLVVAAGGLTVWGKSHLVGQEAIDRPVVSWFDGRILERQDQPAHDRVRFILVTKMPESDEAVKIRVNMPQELDQPELLSGAYVRVRARLMPPAPPMLPGGYNFARKAWFSGLAGTGSVIAPVQVLKTVDNNDGMRALQSSLSRHVREKLEGSGGAIAATLASGDRGAIPERDAQAMRDSGLAHLLSISGLHVSAVIGVTYLLAIRLFALLPWLALRVRLPVLAAGTGAMAGIFYTLLTGGEVPTVRSCIGALLVLAALALGREALSLRMLAVAAFLVLLLWPESLVGPSFQMSFAAVMSIVVLSQSAPVRKYLAPREEGWSSRTMRYVGMLALTGLVIEAVLMPIGLFHFHRGGVYGAMANVIAIPLTTLIVMPTIAFALLLDGVGMGAPVWALAGASLDGLLGLAHFVSSRPGAVTVLPAMGMGSYLLFIAGGLWFAFWNSRIRFVGLIPATIGVISLATLNPPDILISGDGRHVGISEPGEVDLLVLRDSRSNYITGKLTELAGMDGSTRLLTGWDKARCNRDFCVASLNRGERTWHILITRSRDFVPERALAAACHRADIVIADRYLPWSCRPKWLKADRSMLSQTGGMSINLEQGNVRSVAHEQGQHGWWRGR